MTQATRSLTISRESPERRRASTEIQVYDADWRRLISSRAGSFTEPVIGGDHLCFKSDGQRQAQGVVHGHACRDGKKRSAKLEVPTCIACVSEKDRSIPDEGSDPEQHDRDAWIDLQGLRP